MLALMFGALFAWRLGSAPLVNPDEGRYAEVPREMLASGDWVTPRLDGVPYFEKPPLVYWAVAACERFLGPSEWSVRLTPALFAVGGILMAYCAARRLYGRDAGFWAAIVLGTSLLYMAMGHLVGLDMAVSVLMGATLFCFVLGMQEQPGRRRRWLFYGLYASAALATLTKGLIGFLITGAVMLLWLVLADQWRRLRPLYLPERDRDLPGDRRAVARPRGGPQSGLGALLLRLRALGALPREGARPVRAVLVVSSRS